MKNIDFKKLTNKLRKLATDNQNPPLPKPYERFPVRPEDMTKPGTQNPTSEPKQPEFSGNMTGFETQNPTSKPKPYPTSEPKQLEFPGNMNTAEEKFKNYFKEIIASSEDFPWMLENVPSAGKDNCEWCGDKMEPHESKSDSMHPECRKKHNRVQKQYEDKHE